MTQFLHLAIYIPPPHMYLPVSRLTSTSSVTKVKCHFPPIALVVDVCRVWDQVGPRGEARAQSYAWLRIPRTLDVWVESAQ